MLPIWSRPQSKIAVLLWLGLLPSSTGCVSAPAEFRNSSPIALQRGVFSGYKYTYQGGEAEKLLGFISYSSSFRELMSQQPAALAEAKRAVPFQYLTGVALAGFTYSSLRYSSSDADAFGTEFQMMVGSVALFGVFSNLANKHALNSVRIFNAGVGDSGEAASWMRPVFATLPNTLRFDPVRGNYGIGWRLGTPRNW